MEIFKVGLWMMKHFFLLNFNLVSYLNQVKLAFFKGHGGAVSVNIESIPSFILHEWTTTMLKGIVAKESILIIVTPVLYCILLFFNLLMILLLELQFGIQKYQYYNKMKIYITKVSNLKLL